MSDAPRAPAASAAPLAPGESAIPVVVTRPHAQALPFAERLRAIGRAPVIFPLLEIAPLDDTSTLREHLADIGRYALVAFVSPNAIDAALPHIVHWPPAVAAAVVGEGSRQALERHRIAPPNYTVHVPQDPARSDSEGLVAALDVSRLAGMRVLIVRGESGREFMADALRAAGAQVEQLAAYRRIAPVLDAERRAQLERLLDQGADWVVTSSEALRNLKRMAQETGGHALVEKLQRQHFLVSHARIAETAATLGCANVMLTASGDEPLLAALQSRP